MDMLVIILRLIHIVFGATWIGMMVMNVVFLMPAMRDAGPAAGPVMQGLQRRKFMIATPVIALLTIGSGFWLMERVWGGVSGLMASRAGQTYATGATLAIVAFLVGVIFMRPVMMKSAALAQSMGSLPESERPAAGAEMNRLRRLGATMSAVLTVMLLLATAAMAIARYVV